MSTFRERRTIDNVVLQERVYDYASGEVQSQPAHESISDRRAPIRAWLEDYTNTWREVPPGWSMSSYQGHTVRVVIIAWVQKETANLNWWGYWWGQ